LAAVAGDISRFVLAIFCQTSRILPEGRISYLVSFLIEIKKLLENGHKPHNNNMFLVVIQYVDCCL